MPFVGIRARRWHNTNFAQTTKNDFFFKKNTLKILPFAKFAVPLHRVTNITYLGLRIWRILLTLERGRDYGLRFESSYAHYLKLFLINLNKMKKTTMLQKAVFMAYILAGVIFAEHPEVIIPVFISGIYLCHRGFFGKE